MVINFVNRFKKIIETKKNNKEDTINNDAWPARCYKN